MNPILLRNIANNSAIQHLGDSAFTYRRAHTHVLSVFFWYTGHSNHPVLEVESNNAAESHRGAVHR